MANGVRPTTLDEFGAAFSIVGEPQEEFAEEKKERLLQPFSHDFHVEEARAKSEHAQEIKETLQKDFDGIGLG